MARDLSPAYSSRWLTSPVTRSLFGHRAPFSIVTYRGRRSTDGLQQSPVIAFPQRGGFVIPLIQKSSMEWVRVVVSTGECRLQYRRRLYPLRRPILIKVHPSEISMPGWLQTVFAATGRVDYLRLKVNFAEPIDLVTLDETPKV